MERAQIKKLLDQWVDNGLLGSRMTFKEMEKKEGEKTLKMKLKHGLLVPTSFSLNVYVSPKISKQFESLLAEKQVLSMQGAMVFHNVNTLYKVDALCTRGELLKYIRLGKNALIYIS